MTGRLPDPADTENYKRIPFQFTEECNTNQNLIPFNFINFNFIFPTVSSKNVFLRLPDAFSPTERMILQASGNLQRILSAYYNVPSHVKIIKNDVVQSTEIPHMQFERKIEMYFEDKFAYDAESILLVKDSNVLELIEKHKYGLGQIFG